MNLNVLPRVVMVDPFALSPRESEFVLVLGRELPTKEAAYALGLKVSSFKVMLSRLMQKTGMDRIRLTILGMRMLEAMAS